MPGLEEGETKKVGQTEKEVHVSGKDNLWLKSDNATFQEIDPATLEPVGIASHHTLYPDLKGPMAGAYARTDPVSGDMFNYNLELGPKSVYRVFQVSRSTGQTSILASISAPDIKAAYLHSFMLTEKYDVLCIYNAYHVKGGVKMLWTKNMLEAIDFEPGRRNNWFVIDRRHGKGVVDTFDSDSFFAFHAVNAWDEPSSTEAGKTDVIAEIPIYENLDVLKRFYRENLKSSLPGSRDFLGEHKDRARPSLTRFKLSNIGADTVPLTSSSALEKVEVVFEAGVDVSLELPTFNPLYATKPSRYIYGAADSGQSTFFDGLLK
jgi:torulene dioxygenase